MSDWGRDMRLWDAVKATAAGVEDDGSYDRPSGPEECAARRAAAFATTAENLGLSEDWGDRPFGVIVEISAPKGVVTLIAFADGASSLFTESGLGIIGRDNHVHVVVQAKKLVKEAANHVARLDPTSDFPPPGSGNLRVYFLTRRGVLTTEEPGAVLQTGETVLAPLLGISEELISEFLQYELGNEPVGPLRAFDLIKALAIVAVIAGLTYAAWLIPFAWLRWPAVAIGIFFTIAALIVPYAMLTATRTEEAPEAA